VLVAGLVVEAPARFRAVFLLFRHPGFSLPRPHSPFYSFAAVAPRAGGAGLTGRKRRTGDRGRKALKFSGIL
jgi:hypothetical protein